jgi:hypothetical protein
MLMSPTKVHLCVEMVIEGNTWHLVTVCGESENPLQYMLEDTSFVNLLFPFKNGSY